MVGGGRREDLKGLYSVNYVMINGNRLFSAICDSKSVSFVKIRGVKMFVKDDAFRMKGEAS